MILEVGAFIDDVCVGAAVVGEYPVQLLAYIDNVRAIYDSTSTIPLKNRYNNAINSCISCHTTECTGPIPRIKKLLIN